MKMRKSENQKKTADPQITQNGLDPKSSLSQVIWEIYNTHIFCGWIDIFLCIIHTQITHYFLHIYDWFYACF